MTGNYEKSAGRRAVAKAYELGIAKEFDKDYVSNKEDAFFRTLTPENLGLAKEILNKYPDRAALLKEAFAQITMEDIKRANNIIQAAWRATTRKEFDDTLAQIRQPKGGTEMMTNVASPGSPPGKIEAVPGHAGDYGKPGYALENDLTTQGGQAGTIRYDEGVEYSPTGAYGGYPRAPSSQVNSSDRQRRSRGLSTGEAHAQHGPVGEGGDLSMVDDFQATKPGDVGPGGSGYSQFPQSKIPSTRAQPNGDKYAGVSFIKAIQGSDVLAESMGRDNSEFKTQEHNVYTQYEASPNKPKSHLHEIAPLRKDWTVGAPSKFTKHREEDEEGKRKEEDIAGDREGQVIANEGRQRAFTPSGADTLDQSSDSDTSTGDQEDYGASFDVNDDDLALNEEARRKRATKLVNRFLKAPTVGDAPGTSFSSPIQITEEEREDDDDELARRATKYDEEADELARKGYGPAAMLKREKAMKIRKRMNSPVRSTFKMYQDLVKYGKVQVDK